MSDFIYNVLLLYLIIGLLHGFKELINDDGEAIEAANSIKFKTSYGKFIYVTILHFIAFIMITVLWVFKYIK